MSKIKNIIPKVQLEMAYFVHEYKYPPSLCMTGNLEYYQMITEYLGPSIPVLFDASLPEDKIYFYPKASELTIENN